MSGLEWSSLAQLYTTCLIALLILQSSQILGEDADNLAIGYTWVRQDIRQGLPTNAVKGGYDSNHTIYIGRAPHEGDLLPAKVAPHLRKAYVSYKGKEYVKYDIEVLVLMRGRFSWTYGSNGEFPPNAVAGGITSYGEVLYVGRTDYKNTKTVGKIHPSEKRLYIPYDNVELSFYAYEVLVFNEAN